MQLLVPPIAICILTSILATNPITICSRLLILIVFKKCIIHVSIELCHAVDLVYTPLVNPILHHVDRKLPIVNRSEHLSSILVVRTSYV